jgi:hypothetical protein
LYLAVYYKKRNKLERMMKLTKRTFKTKDSAGCEFECVAFIASEYGKKIDSECRYTAMGIECTTLKELQDKIAKLLE